MLQAGICRAKKREVSRVGIWRESYAARDILFVRVGSTRDKMSMLCYVVRLREIQKAYNIWVRKPQHRWINKENILSEVYSEGVSFHKTDYSDELL
jgi:hypothetical protein